MLIQTVDITKRYTEGLNGLSNISYNKFSKDLYGLQYTNTEDDDKLLLLLYALNSWDNRAGAINALSSQQILIIMETISKMNAGPLASLILTVNKNCCGDTNLATAPVVNSTLETLDSSSVDLSLVNNMLSAVSRISADAGNASEIRADGLYTPTGGGGGGGDDIGSGSAF